MASDTTTPITIENGNIERAKETFWKMINNNNSSSVMTLNITLYLGGRGVNGSSSSSALNCGLSAQNPCQSFVQIFYSMNHTLFESYSEFLNMKSVERSVVLKVIVLAEEQFMCVDELYVLERFELLRYFIEMTYLDGYSNIVACYPKYTVQLKALVIPSGFTAMYFHDLQLNDVNIFDQFISVMLENCIFNGARIFDNGLVDSSNRGEYFIIENCVLYTSTVVYYRDKVVIYNSTLDYIFVLLSCDSVFIIDTVARTAVDVQETKIVHFERSVIGLVHMFVCDDVTFIDCETTTVNQKTSLKYAYGTYLNILAQSGTKISVKNTRLLSGFYFASVNSYQQATFENITLKENGIPAIGDTTALLILKDIVVTTLGNLKLDSRFSYIFLDSYSILNVRDCDFSQRRQLHIFNPMAIAFKSQVSLIGSKFSKSVYSAVLITSAARLIIENCHFENNLSTYGGAAIFMKYLAWNIIIKSSKFINNRVSCGVFPNSADGALCGGGALSIASTGIDSYRYEMYNNQFIGNYAERGGAIYFPNGTYELSFYNSQFFNNTARLSGGAMYFFRLDQPSVNGCSFVDNRAVIGSDNAILLELVSAQFSGTLPHLVDGNYELIIGEKYNISFLVTTKDGKPVPFSDQTLGFSSPSTFIKFSSIQYDNYFSFTMNIFGNSNLSQSFTNPTKLVIGTGFKHIEIPIVIGECKSGTILEKSITQDSNIFNYECKAIPEFPIGMYVAIIVGSSLFLFVLGILFGLGLYCCVTTIKKLNRLKRKERAEQAIENKLIDKRMLFEWTDDEQQYYESNSNIENASSSTKYKSISDDTELSQSFMKNSEKYKKEESFIIPIEEITIEKRIGEGGSANVFLGTWSNIKVAIKSLKFDFSGDFGGNEEFEKEAAVLSRLRHANVLIFYGICMTEKSKYIVTEYMENGSLERFIASAKNSNFTNQHFQNVLRILMHISNGMIYLHSLKPAIIHRDLKPGNVLLNEKNLAKVSDFGLVKLVSNTVQTNMTKQIGTILYCSPETFTSDTQIESREATKIDVYSYSMILYEMLFRLSPFYHVKNTFKVPPLVINGKRPIIPFDVSDENEVYQWITTNTQLVINSETVGCIQSFVKLMMDCWSQNPTDRPSFNIIYETLEKISEKII